jgi:PKD repeat protein
LIIADYNGAVTVGHTLVITGKLNSTKQTEPLTANFTYLSDANSFISIVTGGTPPYKYNWDFGNGITSKLAEPQHTFTAGNHTVKLTITDASTPIKTFVVNQTVTITQPPISTSIQADFTYQNPTKSDTPVPFHGVTSEGSYITNWIFGDGAMQQVGSVVQGNRTSTVTHTYTVAGTYAVTMQVRNIIGTSTNVTHYLTIQPNSSTGSNGPSPSSSSSNNNSGKSQSNNSGSSNNNSQPTPASSIPSSSQSNILNNYWYIIAILLVLVITIPVVIFAYSHLHSEIARDNSGKSEIDPVTDQ